ncbi:TonB-dependent receptor [Algoriphagus aestuariicola]|uniref:TonB-dependent receptor n=1 Tax=Algoriphagus aestuariicola TaxID=1852016 RepID=A0ABS3BM29_9BACT|nr:TonB-dependent receptor [Algoriphagus aestuariicola]MBN7800352.1 TonB-dependent receptor [Algoriphagus aestuariicola]
MKMPLPLSKEAWTAEISSLARLSMMTALLFLAVSLTAFAQSVQVSGKILDSTGFGLPGVTVLEKGTNTGTVSDVDGNYTINVSSTQATLVFSFVGYETQEILVGNQTTIDLTLQEAIGALDEVLVIGYGSQKEKDLTSAIVTVKPEDITKTPATNAMQSLQGRVAGVQIVSNGAPGASPTVRVRGVGSFEGNAAPLYVVDGMFFDNIDFLNPNDIENISVLKDASASAIYGVRASNGVILVTTKSGSYEQAPEIVYDGYFGVQVPQNVLKMANTQQFAQYIRETGSAPDIAFLENAIQRYGRSRVDPSLPDVNTDWYSEIMSPASIQNHSLTFNGGSAKTRYSIGGSYFSQDGLQNEIRNEYKRINLRAKVDTDVKDWLTVGGNFNFAVARQYVGEDAAWFRAYFAVPTIPVYDPLNTAATPEMLSNAQQVGYRGSQNPFYPLLYTDNRNNVAKVTGNLYADLNIIPDRLDFRTSYNYSLALVNARNVNFAYNDGVTESQSALRRQNETGFNQIIDNYFTYNNIWGDHMLTVTAGQSFRSEYAEVLFARGTGLSPSPTWENEEFWYLSNAQNLDLDGIGDANGNTINSQLNYLSFFGRVAYNYDERYLLYGTYRRDGNNKFQQKWGDFFTIGAGWVITEEEFFGMESINFLKLRASWGQLGNDGIRPSIGAPTLQETNTALGDVRYNGRRLNPTFDLIDRWETTVEKNFGLNAKLLENRLSIDADYFIRDTKNLAVSIIPPVFRSTERRSVGEIRNQGFELNLSWADDINDDFSYFIGANFATLKNTVQSLGGPTSLDAGSAEFRQRSIIGEPYQAFFGYETLGVFQNEAMIENSGYTQEFIETNNLVPGDLIFKDQNGDGLVNDQDRVVLGSFLPKLTYGANLGFSWKDLEFSTLIQGQNGHKILNRKRGEIIFTNDTNIDADLATNLWRGEGTSDKYPSAAGLRKGWNQNFSNYFVEDGSYFRIQNVQLAYTIRDIFGGKVPATRLTFTAERPLTVFNYNGFNPEVANGIDRQTYPIPAVYTFGLNVKF